MKILTLNTWQERGPWRKRWDRILGGLKVYQPEVVGFQEVFNASWALEVQKLSGYPYLIYPKTPGGQMFLSKYPVLESGSMTMRTKSPTEDYLRYALFARLQAVHGAISFFNTHLSWRVPEGDIRLQQGSELLSFIREKAGSDPIVAMGDFNAASQTPEVRYFIEKGNFTDTYALKHQGEPESAGLTWDNLNPYAASASARLPDRRIDYIFMRGLNLSALKAVQRVYTEPQDGIYASDHYGVLLDWMQYEP